MIAIDITSDPVCPWCFVGKRRLERALAQRPDYRVAIRWRPFQLNPDMPAGGMDRKEYLSRKFGGSARADRIYQTVRHAGVMEGLDFRFERITRQPNTFDAHRLIRWASAGEQQEQLVERMFQLYFFEGADIGKQQLLINLAQEIGMDHDLIRRLFNQDADREIVREEEAVARRLGINGVPCYVINQKYAVSGAQDPTVLMEVLDLAARDAKLAGTAAAGQAAGPSPHSAAE